MLRVLRIFAKATLCMGFLGWVAANSGSREGEVIVHVNEPDVKITVGPRTYDIHGQPVEPIVCTLPFGQHELIVMKANRVLMKQRFTVSGQQSTILSAWDPNRRSVEDRPGSAAQPCATGNPAGD
jgi:hypothetical protein